MKKPTLDTSVNIAILVTCLVTVTVVLDRYRTGALSAVPSSPQDILAEGQNAPSLAGVDYGRQSSTLLLFLNSSCRFCTQSMPLYQTLSKNKNKRSPTLVAVSVEALEDTRAYLETYNVRVDEIVVHTTSVPTPTLLLVDEAGVIRRRWVGWQDDAASRDLLRTIGLQP